MSVDLRLLPAMGGLLLGLSLSLGVSCAREDQCTPGYEGCACAGGVTCLGGLKCLSNLCVDPDWVPPTPGGEGGDGGSAGSDGDGGSVDNVAACEALVDELACGSFDPTTFLDCDIYSNLACDISDYFDCVRDTFTCNGGVADVSEVAQCASLGTCE